MSKKCENCGKELEETSKFCPYCGKEQRDDGGEKKADANGPELSESPLESAKSTEIQENAAGEASDVVPEQTEKPAEKQTKEQAGKNEQMEKVAEKSKELFAKATDQKNRKVIGIAAVAAVLIVGCLIYFLTKPTTIRLAEYLEAPTYSGLDGEGTVTVNFTDELGKVLEKEIMDSADLPKNEDDYSLEDLDTAIVIYDLIATPAEIHVSPDEGLSNGDQITVSFSYDNEVFKEYGIKLEGKEVTYDVEGLQEAITLDAFASDVFNVPEDKEGIHVEFGDVSPNATLDIRNDLPSGHELYDVSYTAEQTYGIRKGDEIKITAELSESMIEEGYVLKEESTTVTCDKVSEYIDSLDDIDAETWTMIREQCDDLKKAMVDQGEWWIDTAEYGRVRAFEVNNYRYKKAYLLSGKKEWKLVFGQKTTVWSLNF